MRPTQRFKIVSGGQTGVDRGALDAALGTGTSCGGWCPAGRKAEDGRIPDTYPVKELASSSYADRTLRNVRDSDGTLIIHFGQLEGGTEQTRTYCLTENKPYQLVDGDLSEPGQAALLVATFVHRHGISTLNVAGPRASKVPRAGDYARAALSIFLTPRRTTPEM